MDGEVVNKRVKATENTTLAKLSFFDQINLLIARLNNDETAELKANQRVSQQSLTMQASLENLFRNATKEFDTGKHNSVTLSVSSKFIPYLDDVIDSKHGMGRYYDFEIIKRDLPVNVEYMFTVKIKRKIS